MKKLVILIEGSKTKTFPFLKSLQKRFYDYYGIDIKNSDWCKVLQNYLLENNIETKIFKWNGRISSSSILNASKTLAEFIDRLAERCDEITIFSKSLGGIVAAKSVGFCLKKDRIRKIIFVATPHRNKKLLLPTHTRIINVYSPDDKYLHLANNVLNLGLGSIRIINARNIPLNNVRHSEFNKNILIKCNNRKIRLFHFYKDIITN